MAILKKILILLFLQASLFAVTAQQQKQREQVFAKSYEAEYAGKYLQAINYLKQIYKEDDYFINVRLGWLHYLDKQHVISIGYYLKAIKLKPYSIEARFGVIKPYSAKEEWEKVKEQYLQILKIDPQNTIANYWLGVIYYNQKNYTKAVQLFEKNVNLYPLDYDSVIMLAWTKLNLGQYADATILFNHALTLRPKDESATSGLKLIK
ncbi:hypothetical protein MASR2M117_22080 [Paludibacter sp.]